MLQTKPMATLVCNCFGSEFRVAVCQILREYIDGVGLRRVEASSYSYSVLPCALQGSHTAYNRAQRVSVVQVARFLGGHIQSERSILLGNTAPDFSNSS